VTDRDYGVKWSVGKVLAESGKVASLADSRGREIGDWVSEKFKVWVIPTLELPNGGCELHDPVRAAVNGFQGSHNEIWAENA
jgi:hypothetical protein